jgi:hypothetical protein
MTGSIDDVPLSIPVFNISGAATFARLPVTIAFDTRREYLSALRHLLSRQQVPEGSL